VTQTKQQLLEEALSHQGKESKKQAQKSKKPPKVK
jgi:hypothetical protein